jgi:hypothetical protein
LDALGRTILGQLYLRGGEEPFALHEDPSGEASGRVREDNQGQFRDFVFDDDQTSMIKGIDGLAGTRNAPEGR